MSDFLELSDEDNKAYEAMKTEARKPKAEAEPKKEPKEPKPQPEKDDDHEKPSINAPEDHEDAREDSESEPGEDKGSKRPADANDKEKVNGVPPYRLKEEAERRRQAEQQAKEYAARLAKVEEEQRAYREALNQQYNQTQQQQPIPDYNTDPAGYLKFHQDQMARQQQAINQWAAKQEEDRKQQEVRNNFTAQYSRDAMAYRQTNPDFKEAYDYLLNDRKAEYLEAGYTEQQAVQFVNEDEINIAQKAYQDGVSPAERMYKLAARRGYKKADQVQQQNSLDTIRRGAESVKNIGSGGVRSSGPSIDDLLQMSDDDFIKATSNSKWEKMVGKAPAIR